MASTPSPRALEKASGTLFSADGFGRFGDADPDSPWVDEGRRYYLNIVGKYGGPPPPPSPGG